MANPILARISSGSSNNPILSSSNMERANSSWQFKMQQDEQRRMLEQAKQEQIKKQEQLDKAIANANKLIEESNYANSVAGTFSNTLKGMNPFSFEGRKNIVAGVKAAPNKILEAIKSAPPAIEKFRVENAPKIENYFNSLQMPANPSPEQKNQVTQNLKKFYGSLGDTTADWTYRIVTRIPAQAIAEITGKELDPTENKALSVIFGDKIKPYFQATKDAANQFGITNPLAIMGLAMGNIALDFTGWGKLGTKAGEELLQKFAQSQSKREVLKMAEKNGLTLTDRMAAAITRAQTPDEVFNALRDKSIITKDMAEKASQPLQEGTAAEKRAATIRAQKEMVDKSQVDSFQKEIDAYKQSQETAAREAGVSELKSQTKTSSILENKNIQKERAVSSVKDAIFQNPEIIKTPNEIDNKLNNIFKAEDKTPTTLKEKAGNLLDKIRTAVTNKYTPIKNEAVRKEFENITSYRAKAGSFVSDFEEQVIKPNLKNHEDFNKYLFLKRTESRLSTGEKRMMVGDWTNQDVKTGLTNLEERVGKEKFAQMKKSAEVAQGHMDDALKELVDAGVISKDAYDAIKKNNDFYATFKVLKYVDDTENTLRGTGISVNMSKQDVVKMMKGITERDLRLGDIPTAMAEKIYQSRVAAAKNRTMQKLGDMIGKVGGEKFVKIRDAEKVKNRIKVLTQLKAEFKDARKLLRSEKIVNKRVKKLVKSIEKTSKEMEELFDEARVVASEMEKPSKIVELLDKAATRERKIYKLTGELEGGKVATKKAELKQLLLERKKSIQELRNILKENRDIKLKELPKGMEAVSYFRDGIKETIAVPTDVAEAVRGVNASQVGMIMDMFKFFKAPMRLGVTTLNLGFQLNNILFDTLRAGTISKMRIKHPLDAAKFVGDFLQSLVSGFGGNFGYKSRLYKAAEKEGIFSGTVYNTLSHDWGKLEPGKIANYSKLSKYKKFNPIDIFGRVGSAFEETSKLLGFKRGSELVRSGKMTAEDMLYEVRNFAGSPDFSRGGKMTSDLNVLFMFFNARVQGLSSDLRRLAGYAGGKGEAAKSWATIATILGTPVAYNAYRNNTKYYEDYNKLTTWEKHNYIVIFKDSYIKDKNGKDVLDDNGDKIRDAWRIPVRDTLGAVKNMTETLIDYGYSNGDKSFADAMQKFAVATAEDFSPLNITGKNAQERTESVVASTNPVIKSTYEFASGRDTFRHRNTVPDYIEGVDSKTLEPKLQAKIDTPSFYKKLGELTGQSPLKLEQLAANFGAVAVSQFSGATDQRGNALTRRYYKSPYVQLNEEELKQIQGVGNEAAATKLAENIKAGQLWDSIKNKSAEERTAILTEMIKSKELNKSTYDRYQTIKNRDLMNKGLLDAELQKLGVTNGARAKAIYLTIKDKPESERVAILKDLQEKKILTLQVYEQYKSLRQ